MDAREQELQRLADAGNILPREQGELARLRVERETAARASATAVPDNAPSVPHPDDDEYGNEPLEPPCATCGSLAYVVADNAPYCHEHVPPFNPRGNP